MHAFIYEYLFLSSLRENRGREIRNQTWPRRVQENH